MKDTLTAEWARIVTTYPHPGIEFFSTLIVQFLFFWIPCSLYMALDWIAPSFSHRHKIQPIPKQPTRSDIIDCLKVVLCNQAVSTIIHILLLSTNQMSGKSSRYRITAELPGLFEIARDVALSLLIREVSFYYVHRMFHLPMFYARIHKKHHRFVAPVSLAAQYASVTEHIFANIMPVALPGLIFEHHIVSYWIFVASQLVDTSTVHSGYDFFARFADMHDKHHELFTVNYGVFGLWDRLHGTYTASNKSKMKQ